MKRNILLLSLISMLALGAESAQAATAFMSPYDPWMMETPAPAIEAASQDEISIKAEGRKVHVTGAEDEVLEVYNIAGVKVASFTIDAYEKTINLTVPRGVYILRIGKVARKVNIL